jgi:hypothetical protein
LKNGRVLNFDSGILEAKALHLCSICTDGQFKDTQAAGIVAMALDRLERFKGRQRFYSRGRRVAAKKIVPIAL